MCGFEDFLSHLESAIDQKLPNRLLVTDGGYKQWLMVAPIVG